MKKLSMVRAKKTHGPYAAHGSKFYGHQQGRTILQYFEARQVFAVILPIAARANAVSRGLRS
jgi:hypothetical protein